MSSTFDAKAWLGQITADMREAYARNRRVMSFGEYLTLFEIDMPRQVRSAAQYLRDVFDHYGTTTMGLVDERRYLEQFERYLTQVSYWVKHEKYHNPLTGQDEDADEDLMAEVERALHVEAGDRGAAAFRRTIIAKIGAWSLAHRDQKPDYEQIFPRPLAELREAFFAERRKVLRKINEDILVYLVDGPSRMAPDAAAASRRTLDTLQSRFGYCEHCAKDAVLALVRSRYS